MLKSALQINLVHVAPGEFLAERDGLHNWMAGRLEVLRRVLIF